MRQAASTKKTTKASRPTIAKAPGTRVTTDARVWLRANGYGDVADQIDEIRRRCKAAGVTTRRDWWQTLAGGKDGRPCIHYGIEFPVLASAQRRQGVPVTANAIQRNPNETPPPVRVTGRWPRR